MIKYDLDIYKAEHDVLTDAMEWLGTMGNDAADVQYVCGVVDMTNKLLEVGEADEDGEG